MKASVALMSIFRAYKLPLTDAQKALVEKAKDIDLPNEIDDVLDFAANEGAQKLKGAMRKEAFYAADDAMKDVVNGIDDETTKTELMEILKKDGVPTKIRDIYGKIWEKKKALEKASKDGNTDREKQLEAEVTKLNDQLRTASDKEKELEQLKPKAEKAERLEKQLLETNLFSRMQGHASISDERKKERRFKENILLDINEALESKKVYIDPETNKILQKETKLPLTVKGEEYTLDALLNEVAEHEDWKKKSNTTPTGKLPITAEGEVDEEMLGKAAALLD